MSNPLVEMAKQKKQAWLNYRLERESWAHKIEELYKQIIEWVEPLKKEGILKCEITREGYEGDAPEVPPVFFLLGITFFNGETILFQSEEFEVVGAYGRVDMDFGERNIMIILKDQESDWIFTERYGLEKTPTYDFNQENFEQILTEFIESFS